MVPYKALVHNSLILANGAGSSYAEFFSISHGMHPAMEGIMPYAVMSVMRALLPALPPSMRALRTLEHSLNDYSSCLFKRLVASP